MLFKAVIFDLDGTLLNTLDDLADSANRVLAAHNLPVHAHDAYRYFVGEGLQKLIERILPEEQRTEQLVARYAAEFKDVYSTRWHLKSRMYPGVDALLTTLEHAEVPMAVLSNKPHDFTCLCVESLLSTHDFAYVFGARPHIPPKPDATAALELADLFGLSPCEILYLGDTATDMQTAVQAGMFAVGALWGFRPADELKRNGAASLVKTPQELVQFF